MKMQRVNYPNMLPDVNFEEESFVKICARLDEAKMNFKNCNLRKTEEFLELYPILKNLFNCYINYIKSSIEHSSNIDEGKHLPGTLDETENLLTQLNVWFPKEINGEWKNYINRFIITPPGFEDILDRLRKTFKFRDCAIINGNTGKKEPYIKEKQNEEILFGFVDMEGAENSDIPNSASILESECPEDCTQDSRRWICTKCGDFVSHQEKRTLYCSCGSKKYRDKLLICHHPIH